MIRFSFFLLFILIGAISFSQILPDGIQLKISNQFTTSGKKKIKKLVLGTEGEIIGYTRITSELEFIRFGSDLTIQAKNNVSLLSGKKQLIFEKVIETVAGIFVFSSLNDNALNRKVLYYQKLNIVDLKLSSAKILHSKAYNSKGGGITFYIEVSPNKEFILLDITSNISNDTQDYGKETFDVLVFDSEFDKVWREDEIQITEDDERMFRDDRLVTNEGKVIMMSVVFTTEIDDLDDTDDLFSMFKYYVLVMSKEKEHVLYELKSEAGYFADLNYKITDDGNLYVIAISVDKKEDEQSWYFTVLDINSGDFKLETKSDFEEIEGIIFDTENEDNEIVKLIKTKTTNSELSSNFLINNIYTDAQGVTISFESSVTEKSNYTSSRILVGVGAVKFSHKGKQLWSRGFQNIQYSSSSLSDYMYCGTLYSSTGISYIFNFTPMTTTHSNLKKFIWDPKSPSDLYMATIDQDGDLSINLLLKGSKKSFWIPKRTKRLENNEIVFVGFSGKSSKLAKLSIHQ